MKVVLTAKNEIAVIGLPAEFLDILGFAWRTVNAYEAVEHIHQAIAGMVRDRETRLEMEITRVNVIDE